MVQDIPRGFPTLVGIPRVEREARMFTRENLENRLKLLRLILMPTLSRQTNSDFSLAVLTTSNLPTWAMDELRMVLEEALGERAFAVSIPPEALLRRGCRIALGRGIDPEAHRFATFRIDDDDALSLVYVEKLKAQLILSERPEAVTFLPGLECAVDGQARFRRDLRPFTGAGLAMIHHRQDSEACEHFLTVYQLGPHRKVADHIPAVRIEDDFGFLRLIHGSNVSGVGMSQHGAMQRQQGYALMRRVFGYVNPEELIARVTPA